MAGFTITMFGGSALTPGRSVQGPATADWSEMAISYFDSREASSKGIKAATTTGMGLTIYFDPKVDTREGYKGDIEHLTEMLVKVTSKPGMSGQLLWIELWDLSCLSEYKNIIVNTLTEVGGSLQLVKNVRFYHIGVAPAPAVAAPAVAAAVEASAVAAASMTASLMTITNARIAADGPLDVIAFESIDDFTAAFPAPENAYTWPAMRTSANCAATIKAILDKYDVTKYTYLWIELRGPHIRFADAKAAVANEIAARSLCLYADRIKYCRIAEFDAPAL